jgi:hypothetical protein
MIKMPEGPEVSNHHHADTCYKLSTSFFPRSRIMKPEMWRSKMVQTLRMGENIEDRELAEKPSARRCAELAYRTKRSRQERRPLLNTCPWRGQDIGLSAI